MLGFGLGFEFSDSVWLSVEFKDSASVWVWVMIKGQC